VSQKIFCRSGPVGQAPPADPGLGTRAA